MKNKNTLIWVGVASAVLIGGGIFWWMQSRKKQQEALRKKKEEEKKEEEKKEEEKEEPKETKPKSTGSGSGSVGSGGGNPSTGFKDKTEGDAFRKWFRAKYPDWRLYGDVLDETGGYDNPTIRAAFQFNKAGEAYLKELKEKSTTNITPTPTPTKPVETTDPNAPTSTPFLFGGSGTSKLRYKLGDIIYAINNTQAFYKVEGGGFNKFTFYSTASASTKNKLMPVGSQLGEIKEIASGEWYDANNPKVKIRSSALESDLPKTDDGRAIREFWVELKDTTLAPPVGSYVLATTNAQSYVTDDLSVKYEKGGTDVDFSTGNEGLIEFGQYAGQIQKIVRKGGKIAAQVINGKNQVKDDNGNWVSTYWLDYTTIGLRKTSAKVKMNYK